MLVIQVLDDAGNVEGTIAMPAVDVDDFTAQLPEGWYVDVIMDDEEDA